MRRLPLFLLMAAALVAGVALRAMTPEARASFEAFERKAEGGDPEAMYRLSALLERGYDSITPDTLRSLSLLRRSAAAGYAPAQNYLGYLYGEGRMVKADADSSRFWIMRAADAGDPKAAHNAAYMLLHPGGDGRVASADSLALGYLRRAADAGLPQSQTLLADLYAEGRVLRADTARAVALYEKAIAHGFADAQLRLLNMMGPRWRRYGSAASLGEALRYLNMGAPVIAVELLRNIGPAEPETARAYALLGHAYSRGLGVGYDHAKANEYFARAAQLGDPSAQFILAETLEIFPDALRTLLPDLDDDAMTPESLRAAAARAGVTDAATATRRLLAPTETQIPTPAQDPNPNPTRAKARTPNQETPTPATKPTAAKAPSLERGAVPSGSVSKL